MLTICLIALIPSVGATETRVVKSLMAALRADLEALGAPKVQGGDLYFGNTKVSADTVGFGVVKSLGGEASVLVKSGDQFVRVATTLKKEGGTSAVGTTLAADSPALAKLKNGERRIRCRYRSLLRWLSKVTPPRAQASALADAFFLAAVAGVYVDGGLEETNRQIRAGTLVALIAGIISVAFGIIAGQLVRCAFGH